MSVVHLHLLLNHVPVIGALIGVLFLLAAMVRRSNELAKASFALFVLMGLVSLAVFFTGEPAEEAIEHLPGFSQALTEQHEESALVATIIMSVAGGLALLALAIYRKRVLPRLVVTVGLLGSLGASAAMGYAAYLGGQVRHTEVRQGAVSMTESDDRIDR